MDRQDTKAKCRHLKKFDFAAGAYQCLKSGDTVSHDGIFDPTIAPLTFSLVQLSSPPLSLCDKYTCIHMYSV
jgi:hypothetical protein